MVCHVEGNQHKETKMRLSIFLLAISLLITLVCKGETLYAQNQNNAPDTTMIRPDTIIDTTTLSPTFTKPADTMYKPGGDMMPDTNFKGRAPGAPGIEPDAGAMYRNDPDSTKTKTGKPKSGSKTANDTAKSTYISPDKGIGPIKEIKLGPIDTSLVSKGQAFFQGQCVTCHQLDKKKIGPPLRTVTKDRPPEFIMNMLLNTDQMEKKDPEVKKLIAQYGTYMSVLDIKQEQARQLLEYLRWAAQQPPDNK